MLILKQQKVSFKDISSEYDYDNLSSKTIKTKLNDGPNLYRTFFEQLIVSFLLYRRKLERHSYFFLEYLPYNFLV